MYTHRYAVGVTPAMFLLGAFGLRSIRQRVVRYALLLGILALSVFPLVDYYRESLRAPYYRELIRDINLHAREADWVVVYQVDLPLYEYYGLRRDVQLHSYTRAHGVAETLSTAAGRAGGGLWLATYAGPKEFRFLDTADGRYLQVARRQYRSNLALLQYERSIAP
jgi:hypothetical protein